MEPLQDYVSYINSQVKHKDDLKEKRIKRPFVTISHETGAHGLTIAQNLGAYLRAGERRQKFHWTVFDRNLIRIVAEEHHLPQEVLPYLTESTISEIQDIVEETLGLHPSQHVLVNKTSQTILHLAQLGYAVIVGRGANIITAKLAGGVHIRLVSSVESRLDYIQDYLKIDKEDAKDYLEKEDRNRADYVKKYLHKNVDDPLLYDLVINTDKFGPEDAVRLIGDFVLKGHSPKK